MLESKYNHNNNHLGNQLANWMNLEGSLRKYGLQKIGGIPIIVCLFLVGICVRVFQDNQPWSNCFARRK